MNRSKGSTKRKMRLESTPAVRASISFPAGLYETLEEIARKKKVSLAWVVRDAAEKYVTDQGPLPRRK
jgi:metal-responsive CopG/Arc/MetJ family transcriptional regulator